MNNLRKVLSSCITVALGNNRLLLNACVSSGFTFTSNVQLSTNLNKINATVMAQRSITSFFTKTPKKSIETDDETSSSPDKNSSTLTKKKVIEESPISNGKPERRSSKRRLESSGSESNSPKKATPEPSPIKSDKKKKIKRQRIESSDSNTSSASPISALSEERLNINTENKETPARNEERLNINTENKETPALNEERLKINTEKKETPPKTYASPKSKKANVKQEKTPLVEQNGKGDNKKNRSKSPQKNKYKVKVKKETSVGQKKKVKEEEEPEIDEAKKVPEEEYDPSKSKYHPVRDACWSRGQEVPYLALAVTLQAIEGTSARLKIVEILSNYFRSVLVLTPEDLLPSVYMCLNQLAPAYHSLELGIAETYLMKAIGQCTGRTLAQVKSAAQKSGDLGLVAESARATQRTMFASPPLRARQVFAALKDIAHMTGQASVNKKIGKIQSLYVACRHSEARYLIRSLAGKLRIGLAEQSVLQALALATTMTPPEQTDVMDASKGLSAEQFKAKVDSNALIIKTTYCECPNYELLIPVLLQHGVAALPQHCKLTPGIPLKPMLAHPTKGVSEVFNRFEGVSFTCEWKYDGERAQIHVPPGDEGPDLQRASIFSRNQENNTSKYPDVLGRLGTLLKQGVRSCVLDCEAVAFDVINKQILPFQILSTRKRKDANEAEIKVQVCVFVFDILYLNGEPLVRQPLQARRDLLRENLNRVEGVWEFATSLDCSTMEEVQQFLEQSVRGSCEGLMVKTLAGKDATYEIAKRSHNWLKLKKDYLEGVGDTLDVVVIGGYSGRGKRTGVFGGFLLACYDPDTEEYQSLCKIGTGFSDADLKSLSETLQEHVIDGPRGYYRYDSSHEPDTWFSPSCVWEIRCADLSLSPAHRAALGLVDTDKGVSLRFPRFVRVRDDKTPENATSAQQVAELYLSQDQVKNQVSKPMQDDFY